MKSAFHFILIFVSLYGTVLAQSSAPARFGEFLQFLQNPDGSVQSIECQDTASAAHCQDLAAAVCALPRDNLRAALERELRTRHLSSVTPTTPDTARYPAILSAIREADQTTMSRAPATMPEITTYFNTQKSNLISMVGNQPGLTPQMQNEMRQTLASVRLYDFDTYYQELTTRLKRDYPNSTDIENTKEVVDAFTANCGETGMNASAFAMDEKIILCPGFIQATLDSRTGSKEEFLNGLTILFSHEIAHLIGPAAFPTAYTQMGQCFNQLSGNPGYFEQKGEEIAADYWGARALGQRLATTGTSNLHAVEALAQNFGSQCGENNADQYQTANDRINLVMGRNPVMRQVLGCEAPTAERPVCGLLGRQP